MSFERMSISLPVWMRSFIEHQVQMRGFAGASEFFRELIRAEQLRELERERRHSLPVQVRPVEHVVRRPLASAARR